MSVTAAIWLLLFVVLLFRTFKRPIWAVSLYMLTFFAAPHLWWWGRDVPSMRYALWSGVVLLAAVTLRQTLQPLRKFSIVEVAAVGMLLNASFVHVALSVRSAISIDTYTELAKYVLLYYMLRRAIQDKADFKILMATLAIGAAYIGYEVTINERGTFSGSRLEGVGAPSADTANSLASMMLMMLPLAGSLFVGGTKWEKLTAIIAAPLVLNVILLCNSRGAFLGLIGGGLVFLVLARGATRKQAVRSLALGGLALYLLLGDPKILTRFQTTFVGGEDRDNSASSRMTFWRAGLNQLNDYPLGAGGGSFKFVLATRYLREAGSDEDARSLHNGYLTEATDWGVQGLFLKLLFIGGGIAHALGAAKRCRLAGRPQDAILGLCAIVAQTGFLITCMFGSFLNSEWSFWIVAINTRYADLYGPAQPAEAALPKTVVPDRAPRAPAAALGSTS